MQQRGEPTEFDLASDERRNRGRQLRGRSRRRVRIGGAECDGHGLLEVLTVRHQTRVLVEDSTFELAESGTGLDAEFLDEGLAGIREGAQRLGLSSRTVERQHQLLVQLLPEGMLADQGQKIRDQPMVSSERKTEAVAHLERHQSKLLQTRRFADRELLSLDVGERRAAPQRDCLVD